MNRAQRNALLILLFAVAVGGVGAGLGMWLLLPYWLTGNNSAAGTPIPPAAAKNFSEIEEGLFVGGYEFAPPPGIRAVLNVCESKDTYSCEVHAWNPIPDAAPAPKLAWLRQQVAFVAAQRQAGLCVYVHCHAGISRSVMVVTAHLMQKHHWNRDQAIAFVRTKRPQANPNPAFMVLLLEWEQELNDSQVGK
jgi:hypothetical protein